MVDLEELIRNRQDELRSLQPEQPLAKIDSTIWFVVALVVLVVALVVVR